MVTHVSGMYRHDTFGPTTSHVPPMFVQGTPGTPPAVPVRTVQMPTSPQPPVVSSDAPAPVQRGLYDPSYEHDACGVAFVATLRGTPGRDIVDAGLTALLNLDHRGAVGAEVDSGDGAGILTQIPDAFVRDVVDAELPPAAFYAIGMAFLPVDEAEQRVAVAALESIAAEEKL